MDSLFSESLRAFLRPLLPFLDDPEVTEVMVNGPESIWVEKRGKLFRTNARFSEEGAMAAARNLAQFVGRPLTEERPTLDARLPDGSRVHVVLPPVARCGATFAIRKFFKGKLTTDKLIEFGAMSKGMQRLIQACVEMKLNMVVSGGTGSGKTTLLNAISTLIPMDERVLTIEDSAELQLTQDHLVSFETRPADKYGKGEVDMAELLRSALRLRPDRIVVGEVRGGECFTLLQAMNTGHGGSLATTHANTPVDTLRRLESLALMSAVEMPLIAVRAQVASAIHLIICCERLHDGSRKLTHIAEVLPLDARGEYRTQDLFVFTPQRRDPDGTVVGYHAPTGALPSFFGRFSAHGFPDIDEHFFDPLAQGLKAPALPFSEQSARVRWVKSLTDAAGSRRAESSDLNAVAPPAVAVPPPPSGSRPAPKPFSAKAERAPQPTALPVPAKIEAPAEPALVQEEQTARHALPEGFERG